jgi:hypothetical protein
MLLEQAERLADARADCTAGKRRPTRTPMMAITTNSSTSVNPAGRAGFRVPQPQDAVCEVIGNILCAVGPPAIDWPTKTGHERRRWKATLRYRKNCRFPGRSQLEIYFFENQKLTTRCFLRKKVDKRLP